MKREVHFLGHIISAGTIRPSIDKVATVRGFPAPKSAKQVQSFPGLAGFFRKFVAGFASIAKPLSDLLRDDTKFKFETDEMEAFEVLKRALTEEPT